MVAKEFFVIFCTNTVLNTGGDRDRLAVVQEEQC
jgi:hypothetical protein